MLFQETRSTANYIISVFLNLTVIKANWLLTRLSLTAAFSIVPSLEISTVTFTPRLPQSYAISKRAENPLWEERGYNPFDWLLKRSKVLASNLRVFQEEIWSKSLLYFLGGTLGQRNVTVRIWLDIYPWLTPDSKAKECKKVLAHFW